MKFLLTALLLLSIACESVPPTAAIEKAAREYLSQPKESTFSNTNIAPRKLNGITLKKQTDTFYVVSVDVTKGDGRTGVETLICREFRQDSATYWKCEEYTKGKVKAFGGKE